MAKSLYICYFGVREPLVQTQVIPYLRELAKGGHEMTLLTFEPKGSELKAGIGHDQVKSELAADGIEWHHLRYHKRPSIPATLFDLANGLRAVRRLARRKPFDIYHVRGHIPAPIGVVAKRLWGGKLLFDIRGFLPEEYVDAGVWGENGTIYTTFKRIERWGMARADGFVVLTEAARDVLFPEASDTGLDKRGRPVEVIPCCLDFSRLNVQLSEREMIREKLGWSDRFVITHIGSLGGLYLTDEIFGLMAAAKRANPKTFALILTQRNTEGAAEKLEAVGFDRDSYLVASVGASEVLDYLVGADVSVSIVKRSYSSASRSPTKIAEYLAAGLPLISSAGVGDTDQLVAKENIGVTLDGFSPVEFDTALAKIDGLLADPSSRTRSAAVAKEYFDLETIGGPRYRRIYERLTRATDVPVSARSLYISYFGVREPLVQTQVIPYLRELAKGGHEMTLLTFEPDVPRDWDDSVRTELRAEGIKWNWLRYHKRPSVPVTLFDLVNGLRFVMRLARAKPFDIYHVRGHIPMMMAVLARRLGRHSAKILFDIRGFLPEEYVDAGIWDEKGTVYRTVKRLEKSMMEAADGFVVLTEAGRDILFPGSQETGADQSGRPVEVIPCCVDVSRFAVAPGTREEMRKRHGVGRRKVLIYIGSFDGFYLTREMFEMFETFLRDRDDRFVLILTQRDQEKIRDALAGRGLSPDEYLVTGVTPAEVPNYLEAGDIGLSFIKATYSKKSSSPTKIAEYLAAGLPVISNKGVGDIDALITNNRVGALVEAFGPESYLGAIEEVSQLGEVRETCRSVAKREFDLTTVGGPRYRRLYECLLGVD